MSGATFSRVKNWTTEVLSNTDLNAEIDNILNNLGPAGVGGYSDTTAQMKLQTSPGAQGSESLASALSGEIERLRYVIQRIMGSSTTYWYDQPPGTISDIVSAFGAGLPANRIVSGKTTGNSSQLCALIPSGTTTSLTLTASTTTPFVYYVNGAQYSITASITVTGLSAAPSTNNTASINATAASGQQFTRLYGMAGSSIPMSAAGTNISNLVGSLAGFKLAGSEYALAYVDSTTGLTNAWRGCFFNSSGANVNETALSNGNEIKLMKLMWVYANTSAGLVVGYTNPTISATQPSSPNTGDYWFDLTTTAWKTYNSVSWQTANATLIGIAIQDATACVGARTLDAYKSYSTYNSIRLYKASGTVIQASAQGTEISVYGSVTKFSFSRPSWDITANLDSGVNRTASWMYYAYLKENGSSVLSDRAPITRRELQGLYHPAESWRCIGSAHTDSTSAFDTPVRSFMDAPKSDTMLMSDNLLLYTGTAATVNSTRFADAFPEQFKVFSGASASYTGTSPNVWKDLVTASLTPGIWDLSGSIFTTASGTVGVTGVSFYAAISTQVGGTVADNTAEIIAGYNQNQQIFANQGQGATVYVPRYIINLTATTSVYLKAAWAATVGSTPVMPNSVLTARRVDNLIGSPP